MEHASRRRGEAYKAGAGKALQRVPGRGVENLDRGLSGRKARGDSLGGGVQDDEQACNRPWIGSERRGRAYSVALAAANRKAEIFTAIEAGRRDPPKPG